ncbi:MAG: rhodanese-like domain-containing protein [Bacteriovoracaceae bacterium]|jgi:hypothetical protein|nr:rhodanese-like domain-containing protein [Bacteriovoracaceae bacterium]
MRNSLLVLSVIFSYQLFAKSYTTSDDFCSGINTEAKAKNPTTKHRDVIGKMANTLLASNAKDCSFIKEQLGKKGVVLVDARDKGARKSTGTFAGVAKITSDHHNNKKHNFTEEKLTKKFKKYFKKKGEVISSLDEIKEKKLILFCNGLKCYRSPWAACSLNKMGFKKENIFVVLDGYDGLKKNCLK